MYVYCRIFLKVNHHKPLKKQTISKTTQYHHTIKKRRNHTMITLIGTGHIFNLTTALQTIFDNKNPDLICVELDTQRYQALQLKQQNPDLYEHTEQNLPLMYKLLARFQDTMASQYGVIAGSEMLTAITYAQQHQIPLEFIDMNAQHLFTNMWKTMPLFERFKLFLSGFAGFFISKKTVEKELQHMQENFDTYLNEIGKKFPTIKRVLIDDRNTYMTNRLLQLHEKCQNIIACVGDGHIPGMTQLIQTKNIEIQTIRLQELKNTQPATNVDTSSAHFTTNYERI
ncbi:MAG: TraB domain-containing protein [Methanobacteriota archaeon]